MNFYFHHLHESMGNANTFVVPNFLYRFSLHQRDPFTLSTFLKALLWHLLKYQARSLMEISISEHLSSTITYPKKNAFLLGFI